MANQPVKFRKGVSTSLPKTPTNETIGAFLLETDTGNLYVDDNSTNRIQIKDNTKLPLSGGELTGPINFNTDSLPQKTLQYVTGIDGFAEGGQLGWQRKEEFLAGYDIQSLINTLDVGTSNPVDDNYYIAQDASGTNKYYRRKHSSLYNYIKSKTDTVYATKKHNHDDNYIKLSPDGTNNLIGTDNKINSVYLPTYTSSDSTLVVGSKNTSSTNEAVSSNSIYLNLFDGKTLANSHNIVGTGATTVSSDTDGKITINTPTVTIPTTLPNDNPLTIQINSGTDENTDLFIYDGKEDKSINIKSGEYITVTPDGDGNITIEGNYKSATSVKPGLVKLSNESGNSEDTAVTQYLVSSKVDELNTRIEALDTKIDEYTQSTDISDYVRCADKVIETGYIDNTYTQVIDNNKISFNQGDTTIASIHDNKIESENVIVHNSINIGDEDSGIFEVLVDSTNGLIIR